MPKTKFPKKLIVIQDTDIDEDSYFIASETPEEISEEHGDQPVAVYELVAVGKFCVFLRTSRPSW